MFSDEKPPEIYCPENQLVMASERSSMVAVTWKNPNATDDSGHHPEVSCNRLSGTNFTVGVTTVTCEAVDRNGNKAACSFNITIIGKLTVGRLYCTLFLSSPYILIWRNTNNVV